MPDTPHTAARPTVASDGEPTEAAYFKLRSSLADCLPAIGDQEWRDFFDSLAQGKPAVEFKLQLSLDVTLPRVLLKGASPEEDALLRKHLLADGPQFGVATIGGQEMPVMIFYDEALEEPVDGETRL